MKTNYGAIVHDKRKSLKLIEEKLAEYSNMSTRHLRNIEKGVTVPELDTVIKIGKSLNMNLGDLGELEIAEKSLEISAFLVFFSVGSKST